jgi:broad specificity phosphatase PhoE
MTTTFLLVRHAAHALQGLVLAGRMPGVPLGPAGREQAAALARVLGRRDVAALQAGPMQRAQETARPVAAELGLGVETVAALDEIDFGDWQGEDFEALADDPRWQRWNNGRAGARAPGGESMREVQARIRGHLERMCGLYPDRTLVLVSHGDVIKAALLHVLGAPLDAHGRIEVDPASISTVVLGDWGGRIVALNERIAA